MMDELINQISVLGRQIIGAICLGRYCSSYRISHPAISALIEHLWALPRAATPDEFVAWERSRFALDVNGLGDPIPEEVMNAIPPDIRQEFVLLVGHVVEIGMCNAYGAVTNESSDYLQKVFEILRRRGVPVPNIAPFTLTSYSERHGWGNRIADDILYEWKAIEERSGRSTVPTCDGR